jgi:hypothetical protein
MILRVGEAQVVSPQIHTLMKLFRCDLVVPAYVREYLWIIGQLIK